MWGCKVVILVFDVFCDKMFYIRVRWGYFWFFGVVFVVREGDDIFIFIGFSLNDLVVL